MKTFPRVALVAIASIALLLGGCSAESKRLRQLERAAEFMKTGDRERARLEYQNVLQKFPDDITAIEGMANIWHDRGSTMRALSFLTKLSSVAPGNLGARVKRAQLLMTLGLSREARREAQGILERSTSAGEALLVLSETVRALEDIKAVEAFLQGFPEKDSVWFQLATANLLNLRGDRPKARAAINRALAVDSKSAAAHAAMGAMQTALNNPTQAAAEHKLAAELSPVRSRYRFQQAGYLAQTGATAAAIEALNAILKEAPDSQSAFRALAQIALAEKRHADALGLLDKALALDAADYEALILRARVWQAQGEVPKAIAEYQRVGGQFPGIGLELPSLGAAQLQNNDVAGATATLEQAVGVFPDNLEVALLLGQLHLRAGQNERVIASMARVLGQRSDLVPAYLLMIDAAKAAGKLDALVALFRQNIATNPNGSLLHYMLGLTLRQQEKLVDARQSLEKAVELTPDFGAALIDLGNLDLLENKTNAARQRGQSLIEKAAKQPGGGLALQAAGRLLVARAYAAEKKWSDTETAALEVLSVDRNLGPAQGLLAQSWSARKGEPGIAARVDAFLAKFPGEPFALRLGAQSMVELGEYAKGRDLYEQFLAKNPNSAVALNNLANLYADQLKDSARGLELARKARAAAPSDPGVADTLGWILYQRKEYPEALALLEESVKGMPASGEVQYHFGLVNRALGKNEPALAALRVAAAVNGDFPGKADAKRVLAEMEKAK